MPYFETRQYADNVAAAAGSGIPDSVVATTTSVASLNRRERLHTITDANWQAKLRFADREGPGIVGASLDMPAATSMLLDLCIRRKTARGYEVVKDDPVLTAILQMWRGDSIDQRSLFSRLIRTLDGPAECYLVLHNAEFVGKGRLFWQLAQTTQCTDKRDGTTEIKGRPDAKAGDRYHQIVQNRWVYHCMNADLEWDGEAWSPMRRGLPHVEQYKAAMRAMTRSLDSQLALNGVLWAKAVGKATGWIDAAKGWSMRAVSSDDGVESVAPFMMSTEEEPKFIETGRRVDDQMIRVAEFFLKAFAQSTDLPTQMLLEGPGQGTMWNSYLEGDFYADMVVAPRWQRACHFITDTHLRPLLRGLPQTASHLNPDDLEVWADDTKIRTKTDNTANVIRARELGIATRDAVGRASGLEDDEIMPLPRGLTDYESWALGRAPATLIPPNATAGYRGAPGLIEGELDVDDGRGLVDPGGGPPDRDDSEDNMRRRLASGPTRPDPDLVDAAIEVEGELRSHRPAYWNDLVPTRRR